MTTTDAGPIRPTKLLRPRVAADAIDRPRLRAVLDRRPDAPLVLVSGPSGSGKTTLLSQWLAERVPVAWVTLDARDDPASVVTHLAAALRPRFPDAGRAALELLRLRGGATPEALAEALAALDADAVAVLDDYQEARHAGVHAALDALLRHPPPRLRLVLATRTDPPLPLARLRARGQLVEVRAADLRFTPAEAAAFLARALPAPPPPEAVEALTARTDGRAVALRLAAVAYQGATATAGATNARQQPPALGRLLDEAFARQPPALQEFLLRTAVPERLCASLCGALLACGSDLPPAAGGGTSPTAPAAVPCANPLLTPLDAPADLPAPPAAASGAAAGDAWYRYHPLLRDHLLRLLPERLGAGAVTALHVRAGAWFAARGLVEEGVDHFLAAGEPAAAAALAEGGVRGLLAAEDWLALDRRLALLPPDEVARRPALLAARARGAQRRGQ